MSSTTQYLDLPLNDYGLSVASTRFSSSHSTLTGLGTTSGKFIMMVGELVRRGIETVMIHRRLGTLSRDIAPENALIADEQLYFRLFEFSR